MEGNLLSGWMESRDENGSVLYINTKHNMVQRQHPFDGYYKELYSKCCFSLFLGR
jgi:hypothetical protein